jgi:hypothetical protein
MRAPSTVKQLRDDNPDANCVLSALGIGVICDY